MSGGGGDVGLPGWLLRPTLISPELQGGPAAAGDAESAHLLAALPPAIRANLPFPALFPVQRTLLQLLLARETSGRGKEASLDPHSHHPLVSARSPRDICVSAPTGSGKTLAYALPILGRLEGRVVPRLRALIVLPTKELAAQVKQVFDSLARGTSLRIASATGQTSFPAERAKLAASSPHGGGGVDVLVCTPGRFLDHVQASPPSFSLEHLEVLVLDEADRLMNQSYQHWLEALLAEVRRCGKATLDLRPTTALDFLPGALGQLDNLAPASLDYAAPQTLWQSRGYALDTFGLPLALENHHNPRGRLMKLLFSATLSKNPEKLAALELHHPLYVTTDTSRPIGDPSTTAAPTARGGEEVSMGEGDAPPAATPRFTAPARLQEFYAVCSTPGDKPLLLLHVLLQQLQQQQLQQQQPKVLIFTKSVEATHRLQQLLVHVLTLLEVEAEQTGTLPPPFGPGAVQAISSNLSATSKQRLLTAFRQASAAILLSSDGMARGIDLGESVHTVINYDVPALHAYLHRIGRTARAEHAGQAITLLTHAQVRHFKGQVRDAVYRPVYGKVFALPGVEEGAIRQAYLYVYLAALRRLEGQERARKRRKLVPSAKDKGAGARRPREGAGDAGHVHGEVEGPVDFAELRRQAQALLQAQGGGQGPLPLATGDPGSMHSERQRLLEALS